MRQGGSNSDYFSLKHRLSRLRRDSNRWSVLTIIIVFFLALPVISIGFTLFKGPGETWGHIVEHLLPGYISNTLFLIVGCSFLVLLVGISTAWLVTRFDFPFRKQMEWLLILPLSIPSYIMAYAYAGVFDYGGSLNLILNSMGLDFVRVDIMNKYGLSYVLSISLFPYVYVSTRAFFLNQANSMFEASKMLGVGELRTFFKLILPLARPAIIAGLVLVLMEVLNDYGAAQYFGINTFTTGIFRAWFSLEEPETAIYLSALLIIIIFALILFEKWQSKHIKVSTLRTSNTHIYRRKGSKGVQMAIFCAVLLPIVLGFIIPVLQLCYWAVLTAHKVFNFDFLILSLQTFGIAMLTAVITVTFATLLIYFSKWSFISFIKSFARMGILGYAIPGAVIAIGVMIPTLMFDKWLIHAMDSFFSYKRGLLLHGTLMVLVYAYCVRFLAVAFNPIESTSLKVDKAIPDSSKMLGVGNLKTFFKIEYPLIKTGIFSALILVFIDVLKELPLTLILKPYHVSTLAVKAYEYASDEMIMEAAIPSLFIIFTATLPVIFLNRLLIKK